jgi:hypothetical protein
MDRLSNALKVAKQMENDRPVAGLVYYFSEGDERVKIGWSVNPHLRLAHAKTFSPRIALLAMEPGDRHLENKRHKQFRAEHIEREWFWRRGSLLKHLNRLQEINETTRL